MDRIVKIILRGDIAGLKASMTAASSSVNDVAKRMTAATREGEAMRQNLSAVGDTAGKFGLVAAAGVAVAVKKFADFDEAISHVAATGDDARGSLDALREAAVEAGARTKYSATEAANAIEQLAKAGVSAKDILAGGLDASLDLAAAGGLEVADAAEIAATTMNQFNLAGSDAGHIADVLAASAGKAMGDVTDMGAAFKYVGPVAAQLGISLEETAGSIAYLAQNGVLGDQAGTSLRGMLTALTSPSKIAKKTMDDLGISLYDAQGAFIGFDGLAGQLKTTMSGLTEAERNEALGRIFGNEQITAARLLYSGGAEAINEWTAKVDDSGYAAETAAIRMDNLKGDVEQLGGALETAFIGTGAGANGPLRDLVQLLTGLVNVYNEMPGPIKTGTLGVLGLTAALGGTVFVASKAVSGYTNLKGNLTGLGANFEGVNKKALAMKAGVGAAGLGLAALSAPAHRASDDLGLLVDAGSAAAIGFAVGGPWGAAIGGGIALLSSLGGSSADAAIDVSGLTATLDQQTGAVTQNTAAWVAKQLQDDGTADKLQMAGVSLQTATDAVLGNKAAMDELNRSTGQGGAVSDALRGSVDSLAESVQGEGEKLGKAQTAADGAAGSTGALADEADRAGDKVEDLSKALDSLLDPLLDQDEASVAWIRSIQSLQDELKKTGGSLDKQTKQGQDNRDSIRDRVEALKASADADLAAGGTQEDFTNKLKRGAKQILASADAAGISKGAVRSYLRELGLTPKNINTLIKADTDDAMNRVRSLQRFINGMNGKTVKVNVVGGTPGGLTANFTGGRVPQGFAGGGKVPGTPPADPLRDNVMAVGARTGVPLTVRSGEWIINEPQSKKNDKWLAAINNGLNIDDIVTGYASGGRVDELEVKRQQAQVRDIERALSEKETVGKGKKKRRRLVLRGLDREIARLELSEAKRELRDIRNNREAKDEAREEQRSTTLSAKSDFAKNFSIGSLSSTAAVDRNLGQMLADSQTFLALLTDLKSKGASPWLLQQLVEAGPTKTAIRLARQYATDSKALAAVNATASQIGSLSGSYAALVTNPRFSSPGAWAAPGATSSSTKTVNVQAIDPSAFTREITRVVRFELNSAAMGASV